MTRPHHLLAAAALCAASSASAAPATSPALAPLNRPAPGAKITPNIPPDQSLGMAQLAAHVNSDGTLIAGAGATGAVHISTGVYEIDFNRDVSSCFYVGSPFGANTVRDVEPRAGDANGVFLAVFDSSNTVADAPFYLIVFCSH